MKEQSEESRVRWIDCLFWFTALVLLFGALGVRGLWTAEGRWAEITREMLITKDFFHPLINGHPYFDKPLVSYWLIALTAPFTGMNEWALRIPSAICGLLALWATRRIGARLWAPAVGRLAGWILLTTYGFMFWARTGEADMANLAFILLAVAWYWRRRDLPNFITYLIFYVLMFIGAQMKGLTAVIIPVLVVLPDLLVEKRWKHLFSFSHFGALVLGSLVYLVPFLYSHGTAQGYASSGLDLVFRENVQRFFVPFDHIEPWYAYFKHVPVLFLPWSLILLVAVVAWIFSPNWRKYSWHSRWLGIAMALIFVFFSASGSRRSYYILPILPFCSWFTALFLLAADRSPWRRVAVGIQSALILLITLAGLAAAVAIPPVSQRLNIPIPGLVSLALAVASLLSLGSWVLVWISRKGLSHATGIPLRFVPLLATTVFFLGAYFCVIQPALEGFRTEESFALEVKETGRTAEEIAFYQQSLENVVFYLDRAPPYHPVVSNSLEAWAYLVGGPNRVVILRRRDLPALQQDFPLEAQGYVAVGEQVFGWDKDKKIGKKMVAWGLDDSL
ncbi:MAG: glycosyltransferase family 39 protein [Kiritimatiellae bacterium]|nr:glycosyltransferase family 39 protein [Kiritimatiellia bacterium]